MTKKFEPKKYSTIPFQKRVEKPWGHEIIYTREEAPTVGKILFVKAGKRLSLQYHDEKIETLCLIDGDGIITISDSNGQSQEVPMEKDRGFFVRPGQIHRVTAISDIIFIESSTPETGNTYRLEDDSKRSTETESMRKSERGWKK